MNLIKHMEAVFVAGVALTVGGSYLADTLPQAHARSSASALVANAAAPQAPVVVIKARRMSAEEKRQSLQDESAPASSI